MGVTYRALLRAQFVVVFERDDGSAHPLIAVTRRDGSYDIWKAATLTVGPDRTVIYERTKKATHDPGAAYLA